MAIHLGANQTSNSVFTSGAAGLNAGVSPGFWSNQTSLTDTETLTSGSGTFVIDCCEGGEDGTDASGIGKTAAFDLSTEQPMIWDFRFTLPTTSTLAIGTYPVVMDIFNFNSTTDVANAIYRLEAEEDGTDGTFTGTVDYATMVHEGNSTNATGIIVTNSDEISLLLAKDMTGTSAPRLLFGDSDESNSLDLIGAQLDANTHSGVVTFDATSYGTDTIVHVTVVDPDLNQSSSTRDSFSQSRDANATVTSVGDTFSVSYNDTITSTANLKLVETGLDTGVFVGQFKTTASGNIGNDLKFTYYDRKNAEGTSVDTYTSVKVATESGTISFDRAVYPVPFRNSWMTVQVCRLIIHL